MIDLGKSCLVALQIETRFFFVHEVATIIQINVLNCIDVPDLSIKATNILNISTTLVSVISFMFPSNMATLPLNPLSTYFQPKYSMSFIYNNKERVNAEENVVTAT